ncbi:MAG: hypothetical protein ACFE95_10930 [Candidatus Hodarchaeota archaeon]
MYEKSKEKSNNDFLFNLRGFRKKSITMIYLVVIVFLLGSFSIVNPGIAYYLEFIAFIFIIFPNIYKKLRFDKISTGFLRLSRFQFLGYLPFVDLRGKWFLEHKGKEQKLESMKDLTRFLSEHWFDFLIVNAGLVALGVRIAFNIQLHMLNEEIQGSDPLSISPTGILFAFAWVPICLAIYFTWVWVWEDAGLKVASLKTPKGTSEKDFETVWLAGEAIRKIIALLAGFSAIMWFVEQFDPGDAPATAMAFGWLLILIFLTGGVAILMGTMYYRSGIHTDFVNNLREYIKKKNEEDLGKEYPISIGTVTYEPFQNTSPKDNSI